MQHNDPPDASGQSAPHGGPSNAARQVPLHDTATPLDAALIPRAVRDLELPVPGLVHDFTLVVPLDPRISLGEHGPFGHRAWVSFSGGEWSARWGGGSVVNGQDSQIITANLSIKVEANYLLKTNDAEPAYIAVKTSGWRTGSPEVLKRMTDSKTWDEVKPAEYSFRLYINLETGDDRYLFLNERMWVASAARMGTSSKLEHMLPALFDDDSADGDGRRKSPTMRIG